MKSFFVFIECLLKVIFTLLTLFGAQWVRADDIAVSVRALGMGNAFTAIVDDTDAVFYNPAGFARMHGFRWTILDPVIGLNNVESYQEYIDLLDQTNDMADLLNELYGDSISVYVGGNKTMMSIGGFTFGAYGVGDTNFLLNNPAFPNLQTSYKIDYGFNVGWGMELVPKMFSVGVQARRVSRQGGNIPIGASTLATLNSDDIEAQLQAKGTGYALDAGANLMFNAPLSPTLSFVWRDMGITKFTPDVDGGTAPGSVDQEMIVGMGFTYESLVMDVRTAIDYRYANSVDRQIGKNIGLGVEFDLPLLDFRAGVHQGYYTLGASLDFWLVRLDLASFGVELGEYPGQLEDRRYMMQIVFDFGLDANFNFINLNRPDIKKHRRKQRR